MMNFCRFVEVFVVHEYFKGSCSSFYFIPSKATENEMRRQNLLVRESRGSLQMVVQSELENDANALYFGAYTKEMNLWSVTVFDCPMKSGVPVFSVENGNVSLKNEALDKEHSDLKIPGLMFAVKLNPMDLNKNCRLKIPLETRKCRWRYCINGDFSQYDVKIHSIDDGTEDTFDVEKKTENFTVFTSKSKIPIVYGDSPKFQLRTKDTSRVLMKSLPNMNSRSLSRIEIEGGGYEIVAESFINL